MMQGLKKNGDGKFTTTKGTVVEGQWIDDTLNGQYYDFS